MNDWKLGVAGALIWLLGVFYGWLLWSPLRGSGGEKEALQRALVLAMLPLEVLKLSASWELSPEVKQAINEAVMAGRAALKST